MIEKIQPNAPRFHALLEKIEGRRVFIMERSVWALVKSKLAENEGVVLDLDDVASMPINYLIHRPYYLAAKANQNTAKVRISIYRYDQKDSEPFNVDTYEIWEDLSSRYDIPQMINRASTDDDTNFRYYLDHYVFMIGTDPGFDHWLAESELPKDVKAYLEREGKI